MEGGGYGDIATNKLFSLTDEGKWTEKFPPMPTKRYSVSIYCTGMALIAVGGTNNNYQKLKTVEVLNIETQQWHTAPDLPEPLASPSLTLCGDLIYLLGGVSEDQKYTKSVYSCSILSSAGSKSLGGRLVSTLTRSKGSTWNRVADLPVKGSTAVTLHGQLLVIGGRESEVKLSTAVHNIMYQPTTDSLEVISHMTTPRSLCLAAVLPDNQLMVVMGGWTARGKKSNSVKFGTVM